jgi:hypothetical protein
MAKPRAPKSKQRNRTSRRKLQRALDSKEVGKLYLEGHSQGAIAEKLEMNHQKVAGILVNLRKHWLALALVDFDTRKAEELAKIDKLESVCWEAWERSCKDEQSHHHREEQELRTVEDGEEEDGEGGGDKRTPLEAVQEAEVEVDRLGGEYITGGRGRRGHVKPLTRKLLTTKIVEEQRKRGMVGDHRFLERISWCIDTRLRILGAYKQNAPQAGVLVIPWDQMTQRPPSNDAIRRAIEEAVREAPPRLEHRSADQTVIDAEVVGEEEHGE